MATFNIRVKLDTTGVRQELRTVQTELGKVERRTAQNSRRAATSIRSATTALTKFAANARQRSGVAVTALGGIVKRLERIDVLVKRITPRLKRLLDGGGSSGRTAGLFREMSTSIASLSKVVAASERRVARLEGQMQKARVTAAATSESIQRINGRLRAMGTAAATSGAKAERSLARMEARMGRTSITASRLATTVRLLFGSFVGGLGVVAAGRALAGFDQAMSSVEAITKATAGEMAVLRDEAKELGATTRFTAQQAAEGMVFLARAGLTANQALQAIEPTLRLAQAGAIDLGRAADLATNILTAFGLEVSQLGRVIDVMALTATSSNTDISQLGEAMKFAGPVARALGVDVETTAAAIGTLSNAGLQASLAGTGLRQVLLKLVRQTGPGQKQLRALGLSASDVNVELRGLIPVLESFRESAVSAGEAAGIFENRGGTAFLALLSGLDTLKELDQQLRLSAGAARRMAQVMDDNLNGSFIRFGSAAQAVLLELGDAGLTSGLRGVVDSLTGGLRLLADSADLVLKVLGVLAGTVIGKVIAGLFKAATGLGKSGRAATVFLNAIRGLFRFFTGWVGLLASGVSALVVFSDEIVISRREIEDYGTVTVTLGDHFSYWGDQIFGVINRIAELRAAAINFFNSRFIQPLFSLLGIGGSGSSTSPVGLASSILSRGSLSNASRVGHRAGAGVAGPASGLSAVERIAMGRQDAERFIRDADARQEIANQRDRRQATLIGSNDDVMRYERINQQVEQTVESLTRENELLEVNGAIRTRLARQHAAEAQAGLRLANVSSRLEELETLRNDAAKQGNLILAARFQAQANSLVRSKEQIETELDRNKALRDTNAAEQSATDLTRQINRERLKGTEAIHAYNAGIEALALNLDSKAIPAFKRMNAELRRNLELARQESAQLQQIRGPRQSYLDGTAALQRLLSQGRITQAEYNDQLKVLSERYLDTIPGVKELVKELERLSKLSDAEALAELNAGDFAASGTFQTGFLGQIAEYLDGLRSFAVEAGAIFGQIAADLSNTVGNEIFGVIRGTQTWKEALGQIGETIAQQVITSFVRLGVQMAINAALGQKVSAAASASISAQMAAVGAAAFAPASLVTLALNGANVIPAQAGIASTIALSKALSLAGRFRDGGLVDGPGGPRDDRILARLSRGEFVVNARAARENRSDLEDMNQGRSRRQPSIGQFTMNVYGVTDADSFKRSQRQIEEGMLRSLGRVAMEERR